MKNIIIFFLFSTFCFGFKLQDEKSKLDSMKRVADAICLLDEEVFIITGDNSSEYTVRQEFLIKNQKADHYGEFMFYENEFAEVNDIEAAIYDTSGNFIKELDLDDIKEAEISLDAFYSGSKYKYFTLMHNQYPFIIKIKHTEEYNTFFIWPDWYPQRSIPVISASYKLVLKEPVKFRYKEFGITDALEKYVEDDDSVYKWTITNLANKKDEDFAPPECNVQKAVLFAPEKFKMNDYEGSYESWNDFGRWYDRISEGKFSLKPDASVQIGNLVREATTDREKIEVLYKYLQEKTRYVAIEDGVSGWQPHAASDVYVNNYGDCKDLSGLLISMLDAVGIKAYQARALTRSKGVVDSSFIRHQFNHCIVFVPLLDDSLWVECTADYIDIDDTPYSIQGINALVIKDDRGELITTPLMNSDKNKSKFSLTSEILHDGSLKFKAHIEATGNHKIYLIGNLERKNTEKDIIYIQNLMNDYFPNVDISDYNVEKNDSIKSILINFEGKVKKFASKKGKRFFINPAIYNRIEKDNIPKESVEEREFPVYYNYPNQIYDEIEIEMVDGYMLEFLPDSVSLTTPFADFCANYSVKDNIIAYHRKLDIKKRIIDVEFYKEYLDFMNAVMKTDNSRIVFKKQK